MSETGDVHYYVVAGANPDAPTVSELQGQTSTYGSPSVSVKAKGTIAVADATQSYEVTIDDTTAETGVTFADGEVLSVFIVAEDDAANAQSAVTDLEITLADDKPPASASGYPKATSVATDAFDLEVTFDEAGTFYYAVMPGTFTLDDSDDTFRDAVVAGSGHGTTPLANSDASGLEIAAPGFSKTVAVSGLAEATAYQVFIVAKDDNSESGAGRTDNVQTTATMKAAKLDVTTADGSGPTIVASVDGTGKTNATLEIELSDEGGKAYFVVVPRGADAPTHAQVKSGANYGAVTLAGSGAFNSGAALTQSVAVTYEVTGLDDSALYTAYFTAEDDGNPDATTSVVYASTATNFPSGAVASADFETKDGTPPAFSADAPPAVSEIAGTSFDLDVTMNEPGVVYYIVVERTTDDPPSTPPTLDEISLSAAAYADTHACGSLTVASADAVATAQIAASFDGVYTDATDQAACETAHAADTSDAKKPLCEACPKVNSESRYWVYFYARDAPSDGSDPNPQTASSRLEVTTVDVTAPTFRDVTPDAAEHLVYVSSNAMDAGGAEETVTVEVMTNLDEAGTAYYLVAKTSADANVVDPTPAQVKACALEDGSGVVGALPAAYAYADADAHETLACAVTTHPKETNATTAFTGLPGEVGVTVFVVAEDLENQRTPDASLATNPPTANLQTSVESVEVTTADVAPPEWATLRGAQTPFANATTLAPDAADLAFALSEPGTVYYVVIQWVGKTQEYYAEDYSTYPNGVRVREIPTVAEVLAGQGPDGLAPGATGASPLVVAAGSSASDSNDATNAIEVALTGLAKSEWAHDVYAVATDANGNAQASVATFSFRTTDSTPPAFATEYPKVFTGGTAAQVIVTLDSPGRAFAVASDQGATAYTTAASVKTDASDPTKDGCNATVAVAGGEFSCVIDGLTEDTTYHFFVVAEDSSDAELMSGRAREGEENLVADADVEVVEMKTKDVTPPSYTNAPAVKAGSMDSSGVTFTLETTVSEAGKGYYVVLARDATAPSAMDVKLGVVSGGAAEVFALGSFATAAGSASEVVVTGQSLASETAYTAYVVVEDAESPPNLNDDVKSVELDTPDVTAPALVGSWTTTGAIDAVTASSFDLTVQLSEPGTVFFVVVAKGDGADLTAENVRKLRGGDVGDSRTVVACGAVLAETAHTNVTVTIANDDACTDTMPDGTIAGEDVPALTAGDDVTGDPKCFTCPRILEATEYDVFVVTEDYGGRASPSGAYTGGNNTQTGAPTRVLLAGYPETAASVTTADVTAPTFATDYPKATNFHGDGFDLAVKMDEPGRVYYAIIDKDSTNCDDPASPPSADEVVAGLGLVSGAYACGDADSTRAHGFVDVPQANVEVLKSVSGLGVGTRFSDAYDVFVFAQDDEPSGMSSLTSPNRGDVETFEAATTDVRPPVFADGYPKVDTAVAKAGYGEVETNFTVRVKMDEPGRAFYVAFPASDASPSNVGSGLSGSRPPTPSNVVAGQDYSGAAAAVSGFFDVEDATGEHVDVHVGSKLDSTTYNVYIVAQDDAALDDRTRRLNADGTAVTLTNNTSPVAVVQVDIPDGAAPLFLDGYPAMSDCSDGGFTLKARVNEDSTEVLYAVVAYSSTADAKLTGASSTDPTHQEVEAGTGFAASGSIACSLGSECSEAVTFTALTSGHYQVFVSVKGPADNLGDGEMARSEYETPTKMAPCLLGSGDAAVTWDDSEDTKLTASVELNAPAEVYYVFLPEAAAAPSATQIFAGQDADGNAAANAGSKTIEAEIGTDTELDAFTGVARAETYKLHVATKHASGTMATGPDGAAATYDKDTSYARVPFVSAQRAADARMPFFVDQYPTLTEIRGDSATLTVALDEPGKVYWLVEEKSTSTTPTVASLVSAAADVGAVAGAVDRGVLTVSAAHAPVSARIENLEPKTEYYVYVTAEDDETTPNQMDGVTRRELTAASSNATLKSLTVADADDANAAVTTRPSEVRVGFNAYRAFVGVDTANVAVTLVTTDTQSNDRVRVNGTREQSGQTFTRAVEYGANAFAIVVTAGDEVTTETYELTVVRASDEEATNASLALLDVALHDGTSYFETLNSTHLGGAPWPRCVKGCDANARARCSSVNPECTIDADVRSYVARVPARVQKLKIDARPWSSKAKVFLYTHGNPATNYPGGLPGYSSGKELVAGSTDEVDVAKLADAREMLIEIVVQADDGARVVHQLRVERYGPGVYGEGWTPPRATTASGKYGADDALTTRVGVDPTVRDLTVVPSLDVSPPAFLTTYPKAAQTGATSLEMVVQLDEPGVVFYLIIKNADARDSAYTPREVKEAAALVPSYAKAGNITDQMLVTRETVAAVAGLDASTAYDVWFVAQDDAKDYALRAKPNLQATATKVSVTTPAAR